MLEAIRKFLDAQLSLITDESSDRRDAEHGYEFAAAVLLAEMTRADFEIAEIERAAVIDAMKAVFRLDLAEVERLVGAAEAEADQATCLYHFTRPIDERLSREQKVHLIELLFEVALADGRLDKYEEHFGRRIADLLHVRHGDFIRARHRATARRRPRPGDTPPA
jgi:uncharacterized tellurite resistance protein B-like protein